MLCNKRYRIKSKLGFLIFLTMSVDAFGSGDSLDLMDVGDEQNFVSKSRASQNKKNSPSSVTVIDSERIRDLGATTVAELMRLVPGMSVIQASGWDYRVNFHGTNALIPRRMLILIDGMSFYRFGYERIDWSLLPFSVADIERIEVTRSPSEATYGSNAFQAAINIITRHPKDKPSKEISTVLGSNGLTTGHIWANGNLTDQTTMSIGISTQRDDGFDLVKFDKSKPAVPGAVDDHQISRVLMRSETILDSGAVIELHAGGERAAMEDEEVDPNQLDYPSIGQNDFYLQGKYLLSVGDHKLTSDINYIRTLFYESWSACNPTAAFVSELRELALENSDAAWALLNGKAPVPRNDLEKSLVVKAVSKFKQLGTAELKRPICGWGNQDTDESRKAAEFTDFYQGDTYSLTSGIGLQNVAFNSETYTNGLKTTDYFYVFQNMEVRPKKWLTVNTGYIYEKIRTVESNAFSPKIGLNFHISDTDTLKTVYSQARRMPSILETRADWNYVVRDWDHEFEGKSEGRFFLQTRAPRDLKPEKIESTELAWVGSAFNGSLGYDSRIFYDKLTDLISEKGRYFDLRITNNSSSTLKGIEEEIKYKFSANTTLYAGYAHINSEVTNPYELTMHAKNMGYLQLTHHFDNLTATIAHYSNSKITGESFDKTELTLHGPLITQKGFGLEWSATAGKIWSDEIAYQWVIGNRALNSFEENLQYKVGLSAKF